MTGQTKGRSLLIMGPINHSFDSKIVKQKLFKILRIKSLGTFKPTTSIVSCIAKFFFLQACFYRRVSVHRGGVCSGGCLLHRGVCSAPSTTPPPKERQLLLRMVCILLECILVWNMFSFAFMPIPWIIPIYYCPQTKFAKVMFSQVFVCPHGGTLSVQGSLCPCPWWSLSRGSLSGRPPPYTVTCRWYASYWNAFFLYLYYIVWKKLFTPSVMLE